MVGVLAFQGDFAEHIAVLKDMRVSCLEVRNLKDLSRVDHLIIPGGESTVMCKFLWERFRDGGTMASEIIRRVREDSLAIYGTCAGAILLAKKVTGKNPPKTLGLMDIVVDRNAYGTQMQSFETNISIKGFSWKIPVAFIRAPKITSIGKDVEVLAKHEGVPVLVRQGNLLAGTFHSEVRGKDAVHRNFLDL